MKTTGSWKPSFFIVITSAAAPPVRLLVLEIRHLVMPCWTAESSFFEFLSFHWSEMLQTLQGHYQ